MVFFVLRRKLALSFVRNNALNHSASRHCSPSILAYLPKSQYNSNFVQLSRRYCSYPSGGGEGGADGGNDGAGYKEVGSVRETALIEKEEFDKMPSPIHVPNFVPEVPIIAINRFPLFPGFGKRVQIVKDVILKDLLRRKVKCKQPYVGVFVKKDDNDDSESVPSISQLYTVGSFATITDFHDHGEHLVMGISAHRRIRILEKISEKAESPISSASTQMSKLNGRRTKLQRNKEADKVDPISIKSAPEDAESPNVIFARTENIITSPFERTNEVKASMSAIVQAIRDIVNYSPFIGQQINLMLSPATDVLDNPVFLCDLVAAISISAQTEDLQQMMEESDILRRLDIALTLLEKEKTIMKIREKINKEVEKNVSQQHRKYLLQEQLKAIKKELGIEKDDKTSINEKIDEKIKSLNVPEYALKVIKEEQTKLGFLDPHSSEFSVVRNYLDWLLAVPWGKVSEGSVDLKKAAVILDEDHYGMKDVKNRILEFIAVSILKNSTGGKILCFHGPPGVGKTSIAKSIARVLNRKYFRFSVGGMTDVAEIKGHRRTYVGAMPGKMIQCLKKVETENPLVLIDEIDKISGPGHHGDPASALLELLDPEQNSNFMDHFLDVPVDLSKVLFICTANVTDTIPAALADRMELIEVSGYVAEEKVKIADRYLIPQCRKDCALPEDKLIIQPAAIQNIIKSYCRESGVRNLQKHIEKIFRKAAFKIAGGEEMSEDEESIKKSNHDFSNHSALEDATIVVDNTNLSKFLGREKFTTDRLYEVTPPGIIMGLAWTSMGGSALYIETSLSRRLKFTNQFSNESKEGKTEEIGSLETTGHLGDVMKESTRTAYTVAKNTLMKRVNDNDFLEKAHIHLHVPEGATPKDGPSAGVTITSALISLALNKAAVQNVAMTGEISLTGKVLPVGGIREKIIAAKRAGVQRVIMPAENRKDFEDLPSYIRENVHIDFVSHYDEVYTILFTD